MCASSCDPMIRQSLTSGFEPNEMWQIRLVRNRQQRMNAMTIFGKMSLWVLCESSSSYSLRQITMPQPSTKWKSNDKAANWNMLAIKFMKQNVIQHDHIKQGKGPMSQILPSKSSKHEKTLECHNGFVSKWTPILVWIRSKTKLFEYQY